MFARIVAIVVIVAAAGWFLLGRGGDAEAVTTCLEKAGADVRESERFGQIFPYAIAVRSLERVQSYPEIEGGRFFMVLYGSDRAMLFVGKGSKEAEAFEGTLASLVAEEGGTLTSRRADSALLVYERPGSWPSLDACLD